MKHVLIITYGRSGSTLLQGILNAIDGWLIKGENYNFAFGLYESYSALHKTRNRGRMKDTLQTHPWFGADDIDMERFKKQIKKAIQGVLLPEPTPDTLRCCGFKEIRYLKTLNRDPSGDTLRNYLEFMLSVLDPCQLVFLARNPEDTCKSGWWKNSDKADVVNQLERFNAFALDFCTAHPSSAYCINYEDVVSNNEKVAAMFSFLGEAPDPDKLQQVLMTPHSYDLKSFSPQSIPKGTGSHSRSGLLREADRLYALGKFEAAKSAYREYILAFEANQVNRLPHYVATRAGRQAYVVRASAHHALAYFPIPKNACTSLSRLMWELIHGKAYTGSNVHKDMGFGASELTLRPYENHYKFVVVRDPIERFVSGYRNRVLHHKDLAPLFKATSKAGHRPDINEFAGQIETYIARVKMIANHFQPQVERLGKDLSIFDAVTPIERIDDLVAELSSRVGQQLKLGQYQKKGPTMSIHDLSEKALQQLLEFYAKDYAVLADYYSPERVYEKYKMRI